MMMNKKQYTFSNHELVTLAAYLLGGDAKLIDTEDVAVKVNEIAPGRFAWRKYPDQINKHTVQARLFDARSPKKGAYLIGSDRKGWMLTPNGLNFVTTHASKLKVANVSRVPRNKTELTRHRREREWMLTSPAYGKVKSGNNKAITVQEAEAFFRLDDYITGSARQEKIARIMNTFKNDTELGKAIMILRKKVRNL